MNRIINDECILEVQKAVDIADIISEYIPLTKSGNNYKALCPFHDEKTPSFIVSPQKQIYHCFGCHKGGNVFTFLMAMEKVNFIEAVKMLAEKSGIKLNLKGTAESESADKKRAELLKTNYWAMDWWHKKLTGSEEGEAARQYLKKRGFNQGTLGRFMLGFSPPGWDNLLKQARADNIPNGYLSEVGLILPGKEGQGYYDRFRNRLIFPIFNTRDRVVGFGGRALDNSEPVYLNSPESAIFSKGKSLYGLNFAKESAGKRGTIGIVEGYTDVMLAHQSGFEWLVATLGTALTEHHIKLLRRFVKKVILVYDADAAGLMASSRTLDLFLAEEMELFIAELPKGLDPYDCIKEKGAETFGRALEQAQDLFSYRLSLMKNKYNMAQMNEKLAAIDEVLETVRIIPNIIRRNLLIKRLAEETQTKENFLRLRLSERERQKRFAGPPATRPQVPPTGLNSAEMLALKNIIEILLEHNNLIPDFKRHLIPEEVTTLPYYKIIQEIARLYEKYDQVDLKTLLAVLSENTELVNATVEIVERRTLQDHPDHQSYLADQLAFFSRKQKRTSVLPLLKQRLKQTNAAGRIDRQAEKEYRSLLKGLNK